MVALGIAAALLLWAAIYLDSEKRMGKPNWGWALGSSVLFFLALTSVGAADLGTAAGLGTALGGIAGLWLGTFVLYRALTKEAAARDDRRVRDRPTQKGASSPTEEGVDMSLTKGEESPYDAGRLWGNYCASIMDKGGSFFGAESGDAIGTIRKAFAASDVFRLRILPALLRAADDNDTAEEDFWRGFEDGL